MAERAAPAERRREGGSASRANRVAGEVERGDAAAGPQARCERRGARVPNLILAQIDRADAARPRARSLDAAAQLRSHRRRTDAAERLPAQPRGAAARALKPAPLAAVALAAVAPAAAEQARPLRRAASDVGAAQAPRSLAPVVEGAGGGGEEPLPLFGRAVVEHVQRARAAAPLPRRERVDRHRRSRRDAPERSDSQAAPAGRHGASIGGRRHRARQRGEPAEEGEADAAPQLRRRRWRQRAAAAATHRARALAAVAG